MSGYRPEKFCRLKEAATLLGVSHRWLRRAVKDNLLPSYTLPGSSRTRVVFPSEIVAAIQQTCHRRVAIEDPSLYHVPCDDSPDYFEPDIEDYDPLMDGAGSVSDGDDE